MESKQSKCPTQPYDLTRIPPLALREVARAIKSGDEKYERWDWIKGNFDDDARAALGHINGWLAGTDIDHESGISTLAHAAGRLLMMIERIERGEDIGDWRIPVKDAAQENEKL